MSAILGAVAWLAFMVIFGLCFGLVMGALAERARWLGLFNRSIRQRLSFDEVAELAETVARDGWTKETKTLRPRPTGRFDA